MSWKSKLFGTVVVGGMVFSLSTVAWNGQGSLNNIKTMYNELMDSYTNSLTNIGSYKNVLADKQKELEDLDQMRSNLVAENEAKAQEIAELEQQLEQLQQESDSNNTSNAERIAELEAQLQELQTEYENTEADLNSLVEDYDRVVKELEEANRAVAQLESEIQAQHDQITMSEIISEEDIRAEVGEDVADIYMYFGLAAHSGQTGTTGIEQGKQIAVGNEQDVINALDALELLDNYRESPVQLHFISKTTAYMSSETAFNTMYANATEIANVNADTMEEGKLYKVSGTTNNVRIKVGSNVVSITFDTNRWLNNYKYPELDK